LILRPRSHGLTTKMVSRTKWVAGLVFGAMFALTSRVAFAADAAKPAVVPELVGGISSTAVFANHGFFDAARACFQRYPFSEFHGATGLRQKNCLAEYMKRNGATPQAIAFMRAAPVPAAIAAVRSYGAAAVVYARMMWADGADGWAIVGKSGVLIPLWMPPAIDHDPAYRAFLRDHPGVLLWSDALAWPPAAGSAAGGAHLGFAFALKVCHACATVGTATVVYNFARDGRYRGATLERIAAQ
jgi:hypothetical protein